MRHKMECSICNGHAWYLWLDEEIGMEVRAVCVGCGATGLHDLTMPHATHGEHEEVKTD